MDSYDNIYNAKDWIKVSQYKSGQFLGDDDGFDWFSNITDIFWCPN